MNSLKVLTFGWELAPVLTGGLGVVCRDLTDALSEKGLSITFVVPKLAQAMNYSGFNLINASDYIIDPASLSKITITTPLLPYIDLQRFQNQYINNKFSYEQELYGINLLEEVEKFALTASIIAKNTPHDLIHAHDWMTGIAALRAKEISGKPFIFHVHSTEYDRTANNPHPMILKYEKTALDGADKIIAISEYTKKIIIEKYHIEPAKIIVIHNSIDYSNAEIQESQNYSNGNGHNKMVLFLARLTMQKGADYLLKAAQKVLQKKHNIKFIFVGKGPMLKTLIDLAFDLGISNNVVFAGCMSHEDVDTAYRKADLFVMPSVSEPFGLTCLEAIKNGTPVLLSKQSGASEVVKNALKVDFWDIDAMASKILSVLNMEPLAATLKENGYRDLCKLTWSGQADKVIAVYNQVISETQNR